MAQATGLDESQLLKWANMADLMRISGVGEEYSALLEAAGVDTVKELKQRKADQPRGRMEEVNAARKLVRQRPSVKQVTRVDRAGQVDAGVDLPLGRIRQRLVADRAGLVRDRR